MKKNKLENVLPAEAVKEPKPKPEPKYKPDTPEDYNDSYYHLGKDIEAYPDAVIYIIWSRRGPGKTYSAIRYAWLHDIVTMYIRRTNDDIQTICNFRGDIDDDPSPWAPLNRDMGLNVKPFMLDTGRAVFVECDEEDKPINGMVIDHLVSLNQSKRVKSLNYDKVDWIILDEFIPRPGEVVKRVEGRMVLDIYESVKRDRMKRGREPLKLILMANAEDISTPITNTLEVTDTMAEMQMHGINEYYDAKRKIYFHHLSEEDYPMQECEKQDMFVVMAGTEWAATAYGGEFGYNDFSNVIKLPIKNMRCMFHIKFRRQREGFIYLNRQTGMWYMSSIKGQPLKVYDLNKENDQKRFYFEKVLDLREACINDRMKFEKYSYYDLIVNYKKFYEIG